MNNDERSQWIDNDETLYKWWKLEGGSKADFIKDNREELDKYISEKLNGR